LSSKFNLIALNNISYNEQEGIILGGSSYNNIANNNVSSNYYKGITVLDSSYNNTIKDNDVLNHWADFGIGLTDSFNNSIRKNNISGNKWGIQFSSSSNNSIKCNNISDNLEMGIHFKSASNNNTITGNNVSNDVNGIFIEGSNRNQIMGNNITWNTQDGMYFESASNNTIKTNNLSFNGNGTYLFLSSNNIITGNTAFDQVRHGFVVTGSNDNTLANNTAYNNYHGITITGSNNTAAYNELYSNQHEGMVLSGAEYSTVRNNTAYLNGWRGIYLRNSTRNTIINNTLFDNTNGGMIIWDTSSNNTVKKNDISFNRKYGIWVYSFSTDNNITENDIIDNWNEGLLFEVVSYNNITKNLVLNNDYGIYLTSSTNNRIHHNYIIDNTNQAYDDSNNGNFWDNGYPSGGNYWSDFDEPSEGAFDDFKGSNQMVIGWDGIVDNGIVGGGGMNPYIIDSNSHDEYPLIEPIKNRTFLYEGWNLISIPLIQSETNLGIVLKSITGYYDAVQWFNTTDVNDPWKHNHTLKPTHMNDLDTLDHTMGFWIHITEPGGVLFQYFGTQPTQNQTIPLHPGWNLVGYPSLKSYNRTTGLNNITFGADIDFIQWYDASTKTWHTMGKDDYFVSGRGYWLHVISECEWEVPL
ncbi:MAG: right-handed parallel beta-helix repeat-containing protein, partial [Methanomassiliicoccales archaeon]